MTIVAGCDVGSLTSKAVIMKNGRILASAVIRSTANPQVSADTVFEAALNQKNLTRADIAFCVGTGYGRKQIPFLDLDASEIKCHSRGGHWLLPSVRTIIDIGGQDCKAIRLNETGDVVRFTANDKCASGTGRFLEIMAGLLKVDIADMGAFTKQADAPIMLASTCTVWAQADVVKYLNSGRSPADIGAGVNSAMAKRAAILAAGVGIEDDVFITGGVAKNSGVVADMEKIIGRKIKQTRKADPQIAGAIGAALIAADNINGRAGK